MIHYAIISKKKKYVNAFLPFKKIFLRFRESFFFFDEIRRVISSESHIFTEKIEVYMRIDKFLKVSRVLKRRTVAREACDGGKIVVNGKEVKPSYRVKIGDIVELVYATGTLKIRVLDIKETVKKDEASSLFEVVS